MLNNRKEINHLKKNKENVYEQALETFGKLSQMMMVIEETAELQKEISKNFRGEDNITFIAEEIADVEVMLEQMKILFNIHEDVDKWKDIKVKRLKKRIEFSKYLQSQKEDKKVC